MQLTASEQQLRASNQQLRAEAEERKHAEEKIQQQINELHKSRLTLLSILEDEKMAEEALQQKAKDLELASKYKSEFIYGMVKVDEKFIMLLDMEKVFSAEEVIMFKEKTEEGEGELDKKEEVKKKKSKKK